MRAPPIAVDAAIVALLRELLAGQRQILAALHVLHRAPVAAPLLAALFNWFADDEWTADTLLADAQLEGGDSDLAGALAAIGVHGPADASRLGARLRDLHRAGIAHDGLRLIRVKERNRRGVAEWRVVQDVADDPLHARTADRASSGT